jgi:S1-C subfamily serine protease
MADLFKQLSDAMADTVDSVAWGIVRVEGRKRMGATGMAWRDGVIVTASHVLRRDEGVQVGLPDGKIVSATVVGRDRHTDLAVLHVDASLNPLPQPTQPLRVGNLALALGRPRDQVQATIGVISALGTRRMDGLIQTDVVMYPGFSGGPLVDANGTVQGMNTSGFARGISVAISTATINQIVDTLLEHGHVAQGFLGIGAQPVRLPANHAEAVKQETGLMIVSIEPDSPAEKGGLLLGDIIVSLDGEGTPYLDALLLQLSGSRVGKEVPVKVIRGGALQDVQVTIGEKA